VKRRILVAPSILAADFSRLNREIAALEDSGADMVHIDVMDGHFVPNITIGPPVVRDIRRITKLPLDVHLMIENPSMYIEEFAKAGSDIITVHAESGRDIKGLLSRVKSLGVRAGLSLKPKSGIAMIRDYLDDIDMALIMTVEPGFGGQKFMSDMLPKIRELRGLYSGDIEVDGGIDKDSAARVINAGANVLVAGTYVFKAKDMTEAVKSLRAGGLSGRD